MEEITRQITVAQESHDELATYRDRRAKELTKLEGDRDTLRECIEGRKRQRRRTRSICFIGFGIGVTVVSSILRPLL
ncbi:hypothetical protein KIPB_009317 [Kipferlia bialata]|uniref:Uncharacterized protein n=1 Tax=Kipferlia bialata TaxID=797122 RepID=A0A9K3D3E6_9EUKA|nr:hypothetical protein KIPB_009317 [Kipferlia bialata]|eukprot:g9317.t1